MNTSVQGNTFVERQAQAKCRAARRALLVFQRTAVRLDDELAKTEPDTAAPGFGAVAEVENRSQPFGRNAGTVVPKMQYNLLAAPPACDFDHASLRLRFGGVPKQVIERLAQTPGVAVQLPRSPRQIGHHL